MSGGEVSVRRTSLREKGTLIPKKGEKNPAKKIGKETENGKSMFIYQAMKAFEIWHNIKPEINKEVRDLVKWLE